MCPIVRVQRTRCNRSQAMYVFNIRLIHAFLYNYNLIHKWYWSNLQSIYVLLNTITIITTETDENNVGFFILYGLFCSETDFERTAVFSNRGTSLSVTTCYKLINKCTVQLTTCVEMSLTQSLKFKETVFMKRNIWYLLRTFTSNFTDQVFLMVTFQFLTTASVKMTVSCRAASCILTFNFALSLVM